MDTKTASDQIGHRMFLDEVELEWGAGGSPCGEDHHRGLRSAVERLQEECWIRSRFVERLWRAMNERWEAVMGDPLAAVARCLPERGELEEILRQATHDGLTQGQFSDPMFLNAVETLLRDARAPRQRDIALTYGETILKLWSDQMIRLRFVECLWETVNERCEERTTGGYGALSRCLPPREELEKLLEQTAIEWVEERRRALQPRDRQDERRRWAPAVLSFS